MLDLMRFGARFYYVLHKNSIGHLLRTSRDLFRPLKIFRKENVLYILYFVYIFECYLLNLSYF